jgi:hypothetical protein
VDLTLSRDPGRSVTVEVLGVGFTDFEVQPTIFFFEAGRWNVPQNVDLFAYPDDEDDDETEDVLFAIQEEGTQTTLRVNIDDPTILVGFPPPHDGNAAGLTGLEAWRDGQVPACFLVEKIAVEVATAPGQFSALQIGLYSHGNINSQPDQLLYSSGYLGLGPSGAGRRIFDVEDTTIYNLAGPVTTWVAVEGTTGVTLKTKTSVGSHCSRAHSFGNFLPNPFNAEGSGSSGGDITDGGVSTTDAGTVTVSCNQTPPVAVWIIGRDGTCVNPAKPRRAAPGSSSALLERLIDTARR